MSKVIYLIGPPCSGKSYYIENTLLKQYPNVVIISNDLELEIEAEQQGKTYTDLWGKFPFKIIKQRCRNKFEAATKLGLPVIVDNTNMSRKARGTYDHPKYEKIFIDFRTSVHTIKARLKERNKTGKVISFDVVERMLNDFQPPCAVSENCSKIITVKGEKYG